MEKLSKSNQTFSRTNTPIPRTPSVASGLVTPSLVEDYHKVIAPVQSLGDSVLVKRAGESTPRVTPEVSRPSRNEVMQRLGFLWRKMSKKEREPYTKLYEQENETLKEQMKAYNNSSMFFFFFLIIIF